MLKIAFTPEEIARLDYERYYYSHPRVQRKIEVPYLKAQGLRHHEIKRVARVSENTFRIQIFMKRLGLKRYKAGTIPAKADVEEPEQFKKEKLGPRLKEACAGERAIFL